MATTFDVEHKQTSTYSSYIRYEQVHAQTAHVQDMDTETLLKKNHFPFYLSARSWSLRHARRSAKEHPTLL